MNVKPTNSDSCRSLLKENEQLKETNEILIEENSVNCELIMRIYLDFGKEPLADLLKHLAAIDACHHQVAGSSHAGSHSVEGRFNNDISDDDMCTNNSGFSDHNGDKNGFSDYDRGNHGFNDDDHDNHGFSDDDHDNHGFGDYDDDNHGFND